MKKVIGLVFFYIAFNLFVTPAFATHIKGGEITVSQLSNNDFQITVTGFRDRAGVEWGSGVLDLGDGTEVALTATDWTKMFLDDETEYNIYVITHSYQKAGEYIIGYREYNRNSRILNINSGNSVDSPFYIQANVLVSVEDHQLYSSVFFNASPIFKAQVGKEFSHNMTAFDPGRRGTIRFSLIPCLMAKGTPVFNYEFPEGMEIDENSGLITWTPTNVGTYNINVKVSKFVEGKSIGYTMRDLQVIVEGSGGEGKIEIIDKGASSFIEENVLLMEPEDSISLKLIFSAVGAQTDKFEIISELFEYGEIYSSFSTKDSADYIVGNFSFKAIESLKRKEPYIVTFRGSSLASFEELKKDFTILIYTELPEIEYFEEEEIINSVADHGEKLLSIYPIPTTQFLNFKNANVGDRIEIFSVDGRLLGDHILTENFEVQLDHNTNGLYFYNLWRKHQLLFRGKFIIKREY